MWVVGAGYWGSKIVETLTELNIDVNIIDIRNDQSIEDINNNDPVILATPLWDHFDHARQILTMGNDLYVEKPLTETLKESMELKSLLNKNQILMSGLIYLYNPMVHKIKQMLSDYILGDILYVESNRLNWGIYQTNTSPLLSLAPQDISIFNYLFDELPTNCIAQGTNINNINQFDHVTIFLNYHTFNAKLNLSWYHPEKIRKMTIIGTKGSIVWDDVANEIYHYDGKLNNNKLGSNNLAQTITDTGDKSPLYYELNHFIECCKDRTTPQSDIEVSINVVKVLDRINQSLHTN